MGGADRIASVRTVSIRMVTGPDQKTVTHEIMRPNRIRSEGAGYVLVFDGKRCGYLKGAPSKEGREPGPTLLPVEEGKDFEADIAFLFPAFFDHPAQDLGEEAIEGRACHKLGVSLPMGIRMVYWLDPESFLPVRIVAEVPYQGTVVQAERTVGDYAPSEGVLFPRTVTSTGWGFKGSAAVTKVEVNIPLEDARFEMPEPARAPKSPSEKE
jgi:hypothetical protein